MEKNMIHNLTITILMNNQSGSKQLLSEHGLSIWIEADKQRILFDTGQSGSFISNAISLGIDLRSLDMIVLSHGHYDHTGGIASLFKTTPPPVIYCHPGIVVPRYSRQADGSLKSIGISRENAATLDNNIDRIKWITGPVYITADIGITGPIPRISPVENTGGTFFLDPEGNTPDPIIDDLALWVKTESGLVVITGCCHSGIINTLTFIQSVTGTLPVHAVLGGFHLVHASQERIDSTCDFFRKSSISRILPFHCTGELAVRNMQQQLGRGVLDSPTEYTFSF
jgi:7,8-dihydropterin-6-yl-methyl-4-(beta-D-ribofuranosyl)aminobenzene 5'-phosphate synthase